MVNNVGHYYVVALASLAAGYGRNDALDIARKTQRADEVEETDAYHQYTRGKFDDDTHEEFTNTIERGLHGLTGGGADKVRDLAESRALRAETNTDLGLALHLYGDSFAHEEDGVMHPTGIGHGIESAISKAAAFFSGGLIDESITDPDEIQHDTDEFREYAKGLFGILAERNGLQGDARATAEQKFMHQVDALLATRGAEWQRRVADSFLRLKPGEYRPEEQEVGPGDAAFVDRAVQVAGENEAALAQPEVRPPPTEE